MEIVKRTTLMELPTLTPSVTLEEILQVQRLVLAAPVSDHVIDYAVELVAATRPNRLGALQVARDFIEWGAGPRASQYLILGAKALALLKGKLAPETEDVREVAMPVLQHRVITNYRATGAGKKSRDILEAILKGGEGEGILMQGAAWSSMDPPRDKPGRQPQEQVRGVERKFRKAAGH